MGIVGIAIVIINVLVSLKGFNDPMFFNRFTFEVNRVLHHGEWHRTLTSGFLHVSWNHLFFNMLTLFFFAGDVEARMGPLAFAVIYFGSLIGGNLFSLFIHRNNDLYRAVGASGAVSGVVFAAIAIFPGMQLAFIFIPFGFPAWVYGLGFVLYSMYGIRSQRDNIGHEAHLGGGIIGLLIALIYMPMMISINTLPIALIIVPTVIFIILIIYKPDMLQIHQKYYQYHDYSKRQDPDDQWHEEQQEKVYEMDRILDKIKKHGEESLTEEERHILENFGK